MRSDPDLMVCLHDDGSVSLWRRRGIGSFDYEMCAFTPAAQIQKKGHKRRMPSSLVVSPIDGNNLNGDNNSNNNRLITVSMEGVLLEWGFARKTSDEEIEENRNRDQSGVYDLYYVKRLNRAGRLSITSELESLRPGSCLAVCPDMVDRTYYAAVGTAGGAVQIVDLLNFRIRRSAQVAADPITAVAWANERKLVVCACKPSNKAKGRFTASLAVFDVNSCEVTTLMSKKEASGQLKYVKVSPKKQYFAVAYGQL